MKDSTLSKIEKLVFNNKVEEAQLELSKLGAEYNKNASYLYLRAKVFYLNKTYYLAIDTLLIALEFEQNDEIYDLLGKIYKVLGNEELSRKMLNSNLRHEAANSVKDDLTGIYRKDIQK